MVSERDRGGVGESGERVSERVEGERARARAREEGEIETDRDSERLKRTDPKLPRASAPPAPHIRQARGGGGEEGGVTLRATASTASRARAFMAARGSADCGESGERECGEESE